METAGGHAYNQIPLLKRKANSPVAVNVPGRAGGHGCTAVDQSNQDLRTPDSPT